MTDAKQNSKNKTDEEMFIENPFFVAILVFAIAFFINYLLELDFTRNFFNGCGYYFNSAIYWLNSTIQPPFKNHPFIHIPMLINPVTPEFMGIINPWMWLRGFIISSFTVSQVITILQVKIIKSKNIILASILIGILQLCLYDYPYSAVFSQKVLTFVIQKFYINILVMMFVCLVGILSGIEYAVYLLRNDKINVTSKDAGPGVSVKLINEWE
jgi:hypothetical protein